MRAVGIQEIVNTAGCGKNLLYREFPTKAELVRAYLDWAGQEWERRAAQASQAAPDHASQLIALVQAMADHARETTAPAASERSTWQSLSPRRSLTGTGPATGTRR